MGKRGKGLAEEKSHTLFTNMDESEKKKKKEKRLLFGDLDVVMTGFAGLCGSVILVEKKYEELRTRYPAAFLEKAGEQKLLVRQMAETEVLRYPLSEGGVFAGLWNMAEAAGVGLEIYLKKIPIKQETVEICNFFDINPYKLLSEGSFLILSVNGGRLVTELHKKGIFSEVIGMTTEKNDRVVINGEEKRFLEKHYEEELYKVLTDRREQEP